MQREPLHTQGGEAGGGAGGVKVLRRRMGGGAVGSSGGQAQELGKGRKPSGDLRSGVRWSVPPLFQKRGCGDDRVGSPGLEDKRQG